MLPETWLAPAVILTVVGAVWTLAWWLSKKFDDVRKLVQTRHEQLEAFIMTKLEYHEKHDDTRFNQLNEQIWEIRLRNASKDKVMESLVVDKIKHDRANHKKTQS